MARDERVGFALRRLRVDDRSLALRAQVPHHNYDINTIIDKNLAFHYFSSATASPGLPPCATPMRTWRTARMEASQPSPMLLLYFSNHTLSMAISIAPMRSTTDPVANGAPSDLTCPQSNLHLTPTRRTEFSTERESGQDGEGAPFLPPIPEQEGVAPDEVIPTGPGSEAKATLRWLPETQMKRNKQNPSALITPRSVKVHLTLDPVKIPQITDSGRKSCPPRYGRRRSHSGCQRYVLLPPSICRSFPHSIASLLFLAWFLAFG